MKISLIFKDGLEWEVIEDSDIIAQGIFAYLTNNKPDSTLLINSENGKITKNLSEIQKVEINL